MTYLVNQNIPGILNRRAKNWATEALPGGGTGSVEGGYINWGGPEFHLAILRVMVEPG